MLLGVKHSRNKDRLRHQLWTGRFVLLRVLPLSTLVRTSPTVYCSVSLLNQKDKTFQGTPTLQFRQLFKHHPVVKVFYFLVISCFPSFPSNLLEAFHKAVQLYKLYRSLFKWIQKDVVDSTHGHCNNPSTLDRIFYTIVVRLGVQVMLD